MGLTQQPHHPQSMAAAESTQHNDDDVIVKKPLAMLDELCPWKWWKLDDSNNARGGEDASNKKRGINVFAMAEIKDSPYEETFNAEFGEAMFERLYVLLRPYDHSGEDDDPNAAAALHRRRQPKASPEALKVFGKDNASRVVLFSEEIMKSRVLYSCGWQDGVVSNKNIGKLPPKFLFLCINSSMISGPQDGQLLKRIIRDLDLFDQFHIALDKWGLTEQYKQLKNLKLHTLSSKKPHFFKSIKCLFFILRVWSCYDVLALTSQPLDESILAKVRSCLDIISRSYQEKLRESASAATTAPAAAAAAAATAKTKNNTNDSSTTPTSNNNSGSKKSKATSEASSKKKSNKRARTTTSAPTSSVPRKEVPVCKGDRISILWQMNDGENIFYDGTVTNFRRVNQFKDEFFIEYDDGDKFWTNLAKHTFKIISPATPTMASNDDDDNNNDAGGDGDESSIASCEEHETDPHVSSSSKNLEEEDGSTTDSNPSVAPTVENQSQSVESTDTAQQPSLSPVIPPDGILNETEVELAWLLEESFYAHHQREPVLDFFHKYSTDNFKSRLETLLDFDEENVIKNLVRLDKIVVSKRFTIVRLQIRKRLLLSQDLDGKYRSPQMRTVLRRLHRQSLKMKLMTYGKSNK